MAKILQRNREEIDPAGACVEPSGSKKELPQALMGERERSTKNKGSSWIT